MLITLSGLDGAGKSTLIAMLRRSLEKHNKGVAVLHMDREMGLYAYFRSIRLLMFSPTPGPNGEPIKKERSVDELGYCRGSRLKKAIWRGKYAIFWNKPLRRGVYLVDLVIFFFYRLYIEKLKKQILIMDRYFYDRLVDVAGTRRSWSFIRFLRFLTPTPTLAVYLDVTPEEAYARKREFSVEILRRRRASYQRVFPLVRNSVVLASDLDIDATARSLEKLVIERSCL